MKSNDWIQHAERRLKVAGVGTARLDCLVLFEDCLGVDRAQLLAHPETSLSVAQVSQLNQYVERRAQHEPLAYIRGKTEFYGRNFIIDHRVLEPRPESETIIELLKALALPAKPRIVDVGTGSGALAITAKLELATAEVTGIDVDPGCLKVAKQNAQKHAVQLTLLKSNLLEQLTVSADVLLCNLPYVPDDFHINEAALHEPKLAIFGGPDGLDLYRTLFEQIASAATKPSHVLTESLPSQHKALKMLAKKFGYNETSEDDFIQLFALAPA